jgi:hypothetical protein
MRRISQRLLQQRLQEGREIEAHLRGLARRLERISPEDAEELREMVRPVTLSDRILDAIYRCQDVS